MTMKKITSLSLITCVLLFVLITKNSYSQVDFILAGEVTDDVILHENLSYSATASEMYYNSYDIDLNEDSINDIRLEGFFESHTTFVSCRIILFAYNGCKMAFEGGHLKRFNLNDSIIDSCSYFKNSFGYSWLAAYDLEYFPEQTLYYGGDWFNKVGYFAVKIPADSDTLLGWVYLSVSAELWNIRAEISSYAIKKNNPSGIEDTYIKNPEKIIDVYPNPVKGEMSIQIRDSIKVDNITLLDCRGLKIKEIFVKGSIVKVDIGELPGGIYFVKASTNHGAKVYKVFKM
jgi:hypothetical protein